MWVKRFESADNCTLSKIGLDGETLRAESPFDCGIHLLKATRFGLVGWTEDSGVISGVVLDPDDLSPILDGVGMIHAVVGDRILYRSNRGFALLDRQTGSEISIDSPTRIGGPDYGEVSPDGRQVAISFKHPTWGSTQRLDVWVLNIETLEWTRLPSMPVAAALKSTDEVWAPHGRLVMLGHFDEVSHALATWRPGDSQLQVREVDYEPSAAIVVWCTSVECQ